MKRILEVDKETGLTEIFHHDEATDTITIETRQDVQAHVDAATHLRNDADYTRKNMKEGWLHYAHIPASIVLKLRFEHGLNIYKNEDMKAVFRKINELYPRLKTTEMVHNPKG